MNKEPISYYDILGVNPNATDQAIQAAYRRLASKYHPDKHPQNSKIATFRFQILQEAYRHLKNQKTRAAYNKRFKGKLIAGNDNQKPSSGWRGFWTLLSPVLTKEKQSDGR